MADKSLLDLNEYPGPIDGTEEIHLVHGAAGLEADYRKSLLDIYQGLQVGSDADGDMYYRANGVLARLAKGSAAQVLTMNAEATAPEWADLTGGGGGATPIGGYVIVQTDLAGAEVPDHDTHIKLEAGLTGAGEYNEGKLTNESVTGSAPLVVATAEIADPESPLFGQVVHLLETEERFLRAGQAGRVQNDQMQQITGSVTEGSAAYGITGGQTGVDISSTGAFTHETVNTGVLVAGAGFRSIRMFFDSGDSPNARASSTTDGETRAKNIGVSVYMKIK